MDSIVPIDLKLAADNTELFIAKAFDSIIFGENEMRAFLLILRLRALKKISTGKRLGGLCMSDKMECSNVSPKMATRS